MKREQGGRTYDVRVRVSPAVLQAQRTKSAATALVGTHQSVTPRVIIKCQIAPRATQRQVLVNNGEPW